MQTYLKTIGDISTKYDHYIFDMDGVLYAGNTTIEPAIRAVKYLNDIGKNVYFLTNNSTKSREMILNVLDGLTIKTDIHHVYTSAYLVAVYLQSLNIKKAFNMGMKGISDECKQFGIELIESTSFDGNENVTYDIFRSIQPPKDIGAVVTGYNSMFTYKMLCYGSKCIQDGAVLVAANPDNYIKVGDYLMPAGGCIQGIVERATQKTATLVGKPSKTALEMIMKSNNILEKSKVIMIGDNPETDIEFGNNGGIDTILVTTGVTSLEEGRKVNSTYLCESLYE